MRRRRQFAARGNGTETWTPRGRRTCQTASPIGRALAHFACTSQVEQESASPALDDGAKRKPLTWSLTGAEVIRLRGNTRLCWLVSVKLPNIVQTLKSSKVFPDSSACLSHFGFSPRPDHSCPSESRNLIFAEELGCFAAVGFRFGASAISEKVNCSSSIRS